MKSFNPLARMRRCRELLKSQGHTSSGCEVKAASLHLPCVLVVDDDVICKTLAIKHLEASGYGTLAASNGQQALHLLHEHAINLVLMDIQMPVMDGLKAVSEIRKQGFDVSVLAMTASTCPNEHSVYLESGMQAVLTKPLDMALLSAWLPPLAMD